MNVKTVLFQTIQLSINKQFRSIWPIHRTISGATTPSQGGSGSDGNEEALSIPQISSITGASPSDYLVSYPGTLFWGVLPLSGDVVSVFCSPSRLSQERVECQGNDVEDNERFNDCFCLNTSQFQRRYFLNISRKIVYLYITRIFDLTLQQLRVFFCFNVIVNWDIAIIGYSFIILMLRNGKIVQKRQRCQRIYFVLKIYNVIMSFFVSFFFPLNVTTNVKNK